jgi:transposase
MEMLYAALDVHKHVLQAAVLDPASGELRDARFPATREALREWALPLQGRVAAVAIEATSGWRWVWRELSALGIEVQLAEPAQTRALRGKKRKAKNDRLDARWLALLLSKAMLPRSWVPPEDIQRLRDLTRLRQALRHDRTSWAQRLHALLAHEGWPCARSALLSTKGRRWLDGLQLDPHVRGLVDAHLALIDAVVAQMTEVSASCAASPAATVGWSRCRRSTVSARSSLAICSPRSATRAASAAPTRSSASPASTRSCSTRPSRSGAASSPSRARRTSAGP